jgi:hypothetical protein
MLPRYFTVPFMHFVLPEDGQVHRNMSQIMVNSEYKFIVIDGLLLYILNIIKVGFLEKML